MKICGVIFAAQFLQITVIRQIQPKYGDEQADEGRGG